ncbi:MAG: flagellar filament capping protein FliD [Pseudomonadota bacterium]
MTGISSMGVGSGIDVRGIVDQLLQAEQQPVAQRLDRRETRLEAELSAFGTLKSALSEFDGALGELSDRGSFRSATTSSGDPDAIAVTASGEVEEAASFGIQVEALAAAQSVASGVFDGPSAEVGSGTLTFRFGTVETDGAGAVTGLTQNPDRPTASVEIPEDAATLTDVRDAVNEADMGVRASVIDDGTGERLVFVSERTGAANGFMVDVADDDGATGDGAGLSRLQFNDAAANLSLNRAAADAQLVVDGLTVTRAENEIDDLLPGATLTLQGTNTTPARVGVEPDTGKARERVESFVEAYNALHEKIEEVSGYDPETQEGGVLQGDSLVRSVEFKLRRLMTEQLDALEGQPVRALADIGIRTTRDGSLELDEAKLSEQLEANLEGVAALFAVGGLEDGSGFAFESARSETTPGTYGVEVSRLAERAALTGSAVGVPITIDDSNDELEVTVDGVASGRITLTQGDYADGAALAAELQARINGDDALREAGAGITVAYDPDAAAFTLRSERYGSESEVAVTFADTATAASLGFGTGDRAEGVDVAGTVGGITAEGYGRYLTAQTGPPAGLKVEITGASTGRLGQVTFSRGIGSRLGESVDALLASDGAFSSATGNINGRIEEIGDEREALSERLERMEKRLIDQFSSMDARVAQLNQTGSFLTSEMSGLETLAKSAGQ